MIETCARYKLLVDFHDNPIPMVGLERTWPHAITREYCHAQQDCRRGYDSNEFIRMAWINALMGPMDQANGVYAIEDVTRRDRGAKNGIASTVAAETARTGLIFSGLVTLPDAPEEYRKRGDIFTLIKDAPVVWEESRFLEGTFGEYLVVARRTGITWYVFAANNETGRDVTISLRDFDFSDAVTAEIGKDAPHSHFRDNPGAYLVENKELEPDGSINVRMAPGGGFTLKLTEGKGNE